MQPPKSTAQYDLWPSNTFWSFAGAYSRPTLREYVRHRFRLLENPALIVHLEQQALGRHSGEQLLRVEGEVLLRTPQLLRVLLDDDIGVVEEAFFQLDGFLLGLDQGTRNDWVLTAFNLIISRILWYPLE